MALLVALSPTDLDRRRPIAARSIDQPVSGVASKFGCALGLARLPVKKGAASVTRPTKIAFFFENVVGHVTSHGEIPTSLTGCYRSFSAVL